ncbi:hypothetical protein GO730_27965 [Spirosoma sp. HMF3257]|uniref:Uncharacterized protein n=1 Tax=Spirosoma telluris TaxID=2183553 RepID=A0A327NTC7_9BACT|nr:hypothetical protein [Spirosoma telluris]RAI77054.1 hypothetical protein HMF3257_27900 [Spirosoma telluris]
MPSNLNANGADFFHSLAYQDQLNLIWQRGILLEARRIPGFWLHLYAVNAFFVEMWICQRQYSVNLVRVLTDTNELEPYIDKLSLSELL